MSPTPLLLALAAVTVVVAVRQAVRSRRRGDAAWRLVVLVAGQFALAALLAMFLFPPARGGSDGTLVVLTADSPRPPAGAGADHVALPEAPTHPGIARVPDLGTALRRHPGTRAIRVVGAGLPARDRDAALGVRVVFEPAPLPAGVVALHAPVRVGAGRWKVRNSASGQSRVAERAESPPRLPPRSSWTKRSDAAVLAQLQL